MATTKTPTSPTRRRRMMRTELCCPCGKKLEVSVRKNGWYLSLEAVALANKWQLSDIEGFGGMAARFPALCPECHHHNQCRD